MSLPPSDQQMKVAALVARGLLNKQIAYELGVTEGTIKSHVGELIRRVGQSSGHGGRIRVALWYLGQCDLAERDAILSGARE